MKKKPDEPPAVQAEVVVEPMALSHVEAIERAQIEVLVATAKKFPRNLHACRQSALELATMTKEMAADCFYKIPRGGKIIEGKSVRLAEIIASTWQNIRAGARPVSNDGKHVVAQAFCHDLQTHVLIVREVKRRITDKDGRVFNEDMQTLTENAACAVALRNAIFSVIPGAYVQTIYDKCKQVAVGDATTLEERRTKAVDYFKKMGVDERRIYLALGVKGIEDVGLEQLETLTGMRTAITTGEGKLDDLFPPVPAKTSAPTTGKPLPSGTPEELLNQLATLCKMASITEEKLLAFCLKEKYFPADAGVASVADLAQVCPSRLPMLVGNFGTLQHAIKSS